MAYLENVPRPKSPSMVSDSEGPSSSFINVTDSSFLMKFQYCCLHFTNRDPGYGAEETNVLEMILRMQEKFLAQCLQCLAWDAATIGNIFAWYPWLAIVCICEAAVRNSLEYIPIQSCFPFLGQKQSLKHRTVCDRHSCENNVPLTPCDKFR